MRACIYGAGSLGTVLGAYFSKAHESVDLISQDESHVHALNTYGAKITGTVDFVQAVRALLPSQMTDQYDIIFLMTKHLHNRDVAQYLRAYLSPLGVVVCLQNGIPEPGLIEDLGVHHVLGCVAEWNAVRIAPGCCELMSKPRQMVFRMGVNTYVSAIVRSEVWRLLSKVGTVMMEADLAGVRWSKLLFHAPFSGLGTVIGGTVGDVLRDRHVRSLAVQCMKEIIDVGHAARVTFSPTYGNNIIHLFDCYNIVRQKLVEMLLPITMRRYVNIEPVMLQDVRHNEKCEVNAINGVICDYGRRYGVPTPINDGIWSLILQIEEHEIPIMHDNYRALLN